MITDGEFQRIVTYVKQHYGIDLSQKRVLVGGRLENYLVRNGYANYNELMAKVEHNPKGSEATDLVNILTTNHTYFMRESEHFDFMKDVALPWAKDKTMGTKDLRVWCGASPRGGTVYARHDNQRFFRYQPFGVGHQASCDRYFHEGSIARVQRRLSEGGH